jgi:[protein-PII] uridylyltransferase
VLGPGPRNRLGGIRTVDECIRESAADITVRIAARSAPADRQQALFKKLQARYLADMDAADFFQAKLLEMRQRHAKYQDTPYAWSRTARKARAACATCR